jgi:hypothetical protein
MASSGVAVFPPDRALPPSTVQPPTSGLAAAAIGSLLLLGLAVLWFVFSYQYVEDDAYIHLEFARSVAEGHGFAFDGLVSNGDTAPLWVLYLVALHGSGLDWPGSAKLACVIGVLVTVLAVWRIAFDLSPPGIDRRRVALVAVVLTVLNPFFVHWSFSGMESVTAIGVSLWALWLVFVTQPSWARLGIGAVLLGVGPLLRPELLLLAALAGPMLLLRSWKSSQDRGPLVRAIVLASLGVVMALPVLSWGVYALHTFGSVIPNTNAAKRGGTLAQVAERLALVYAAGFPVTLTLLPVVARRVKLAGVPAAVGMLLWWPLLCIGFYLADHTVVQTRYCLVSMPCLTLALLWGIASTRQERLFRGMVAATVLASSLLIVLTVVPHVANKMASMQQFTAMSAYIHDHLPADEPVAVYPIGIIAFRSRHPIVDLGGIIQPGAVQYWSEQDGMVRWAKLNHARYFISGRPPEPGAVSVYATTMPFLGWTLNPSLYRKRHPFVLYRLP